MAAPIFTSASIAVPPDKTTCLPPLIVVPVAIAPETLYDKDGCFSGTAISTEDKHYLVYTSVLNGLQNQSIAYSYDGIVYNKITNNPILSGRDLPEGFNNYDFRDPKIFKRGDKYYIFCGNADNKGNKQIISFVSDEIEKGWKYLGVVLSRQNVGGIFECPDFLELDNKDILIASPQRIARSSDYEYQNDDSCVYKIGIFSTISGRFVYIGDDSLCNSQFEHPAKDIAARHQSQVYDGTELPLCQQHSHVAHYPEGLRCFSVPLAHGRV